MIYALRHSETTRAEREQIAVAILARHDLSMLPALFALVWHIKDVTDQNLAGPFYCIYCLDVVRPSIGNPPQGNHASNPWYFEHTTPGRNDCVGSNIYLGRSNPPKQGCYVQLGCELVP